MGLGLHGSTEHVSVVNPARMSSDSDDQERMWDVNRGRDAARALLGTAAQQHTSVRMHAKSDSQQRLFQVGESSDESDD